MSELAGVLQQLTQEAVKGMKMADMATGTVVSAAPLSVQTETTLPPIPSKALVLTESVIERIVQLKGGEGGTVVVHEGLKTGDKVLMLRVQNGQKYIVLSRIKGG